MILLMNPRVNRIVNTHCFSFLTRLAETADRRSLGAAGRVLFPYASDRDELFSLRYFVLLVEVLRLWKTIVVPVLRSKEKEEVERRLLGVDWVFGLVSGDFYSNADVLALRDADLVFFGKNREKIGFEYDAVDPEMKKETLRRTVLLQAPHDPRLFSDKKPQNEGGKLSASGDKSSQDVAQLPEKSFGKGSGMELRQMAIMNNRSLSMQNKSAYEKYEKRSNGPTSSHNSNPKSSEKQVADEQSNGVFNNETFSPQVVSAASPNLPSQPQKPADVVSQLQQIQTDLLTEIYKPTVYCDTVLSKKSKLQEYTNANYPLIEQFLYSKDQGSAERQHSLLVDLNFMNELYDLFLRYFETPEKGRESYQQFISALQQAELKYYKTSKRRPDSCGKVHLQMGLLNETQMSELIPPATGFGRALPKFDSDGEQHSFDVIANRTCKEGERTQNEFRYKRDSAHGNNGPGKAVQHMRFQEYFREAENGDAGKGNQAARLVSNMRDVISRESKRSSLTSRGETPQQNARISFDANHQKRKVFNITDDDIEQVLNQHPVQRNPQTKAANGSNHKNFTRSPDRQNHRPSIDESLPKDYARCLSESRTKFAPALLHKQADNSVEHYGSHRTKLSLFSKTTTQQKKTHNTTRPEIKYEVSEYLGDDQMSRLKTENSALKEKANRLKERVITLSVEKILSKERIHSASNRRVFGNENVNSSRSRELLKVLPPNDLMKEFAKKDDHYSELKDKYERLKKKYARTLGGGANGVFASFSKMDHEIERKYMAGNNN